MNPIDTPSNPSTNSSNPSTNSSTNSSNPSINSSTNSSNPSTNSSNPSTNSSNPSNPMETLSISHQNKIQKLVMKLYCLPYCAEFREPVQIMYPHLLEPYLEVIKTPMDLGSILLKIKQNKYKTLTECSKDISLVFNNAILFNGDLSNLVSMSKHLLAFTRSLWHEVMRIPFDESSETNSNFNEMMMMERKANYSFVRNRNMNIEEIQFLQKSVESELESNGVFSKCVEATLGYCQESNAVTLAKIMNVWVSELCDAYPMPDSDSNPDEISKSVTYPTIVFLDSELSSRAFSPSRIEYIYRQLSSEKLATLEALDSIVGELSVVLYEKATRGFSISSIWAQPHDVVWAQPFKSPWWPGMVLAGGTVPKPIEDVNISRLPDQIVRALSKLKPKTRENLNSTSFVPAGMVLVEFFGSHDFGWVRCDALFPLPPDASLSVPPSMKEKREGLGGEKSTHDGSALREAREGYVVMQEEDGIPTSLSDTPPPDFLDVLERKQESLQLLMVSRQQSQTAPKKRRKSLASSGEEGSQPNKKTKKVDLDEEQENISWASDTAGRKLFKSHSGNSVSENKKQAAVIEARRMAIQFQLYRLVVPAPMYRGRPSSDSLLHRSNSDSTLPMDPPTDPPILLTTSIEGSSYEEESAEGGDENSASNMSTCDDEVAPGGSVSNKKRRRRRRGCSNSDVHSFSALSAQEQSLSAFYGCARLVNHKRGKSTTCPVLHSRDVNPNAVVFCLESRSCKERKELLRQELARLTRELDSMKALLAKAPNPSPSKGGSKSSRIRKMKKANADKSIPGTATAHGKARNRTPKLSGGAGGSKKPNSAVTPKSPPAVVEAAKQKDQPEETTQSSSSLSDSYTSAMSMMPFL